MADFIDQQASESERSGSSSPTITEDEGDEPRTKKVKVDKKKKKTKKDKNKKRKIESSDEDEEEDDEEAGREEMKDFIADEEENDEGDDDKSEKSDAQEEDDDLEEDDLDLINENLDLRDRKKPGRIVRPDDSDDDLDDRTAIQKEIFGPGYDDETAETSGRDRQREQDEYSDAASEDSETSRPDDFIEYDKDERRPTRHRHRGRKDLNLPEGALDEARDVFGVEEFDFDDFFVEEDEPVDEEDEEAYADDEERPSESAIRERRKRVKEKRATLLDAIEPTDLEKGYLAPADKKIQLEDRPERFQVRRIRVTEAEETELNMESKWIYQMAFVNKPLSSQDDPQLSYFMRSAGADRAKVDADAPRKIMESLKFIRNHHFEVPFIAFYRKEPLEEILDVTELWRVYRWDMKWCHLQSRKSKLLALMKRMQTYQVEGEEATALRPVTENDLNDVEGVQTLEQWTDAFFQFQLFYAAELPKMAEWEAIRRREMAGDGEEGEEGAAAAMGLDISTKFKQCTRKDKYQLCVEHGIGAMAARFGLSARQFAENLDWKRHEVEQDPMSPLEAAAEYVSTSFISAEDVLGGAIFMLAKEISREPMVRSRVRDYYHRRVSVSVRPTKQGREQMDDSHPVWKKRYIKEKPITDLEADDFLYYHLGKQAGLLEVKLLCDSENDISVKNTLLDTIISDQPFHKDEFSDIAEEWNQLRDKVVRMAIMEMVVPSLELELYSRLLDEAKEFVIRRCAGSLYTRLEMTGFRASRDSVGDDEEDEEVGHVETRILGLVYGIERDDVTFGSLVNEDGAVLDHIRLPYFMNRSKFPHEQRQKKDDVEKLKKFLMRHKPHIIAIAGENVQAKFVKMDIMDVVTSLLANSEIRKQPTVTIHDNEAAKVYMHSKMSEAEHPDYPPNLRQALSLARIVADPLVEYAHLANDEDDLYCLQLHPLQSEVNKEDLHEALSLELINRVNEVGVDINKCVEQAHHANLLQFVCGLGPRKAAHLMKTIRQNNNLLESRTRLVTLCKIGPKVFMNCAGFIKIDTLRVSEKTDSYVEVLDGSRVHPETYEWARKMAVDALEVDDGHDPTAALEEILGTPEKLRDLDLDAFAEELQRQGFGNKGMTLYDIRSELNARYKDLRKQFIEPTDKELFSMLTKETEQSLYPGKLVYAKVERIVYKKENMTDKQPLVKDASSNMFTCPNCDKTMLLADLYEHNNSSDPAIGCRGVPIGTRVRLDNGITGFIKNMNLSDNPTFRSPLERIQLGQTITCRVLRIEPERQSCELTCRSSDLRKSTRDFGDVDRFWDAEAEQDDITKDQEARERRKQASSSNFVKRVIAHPQFHNVTYKDAERMLSKLEQGDAIIRPSSKSINNLTVTWKVADGIYHHIDIQEFEKEKPFTLGRRLMIGPEEFDDLEELLARWIQPMAAFARECLSHKYAFASATNTPPLVTSEKKDEIENRLMDEKKIAPAKIPYCITASTAYPGKFSINYLVRSVRQEYMTVTPTGIRFRQQIFSSLDECLAWFKLHFRERPPGMFGR